MEHRRLTQLTLTADSWRGRSSFCIALAALIILMPFHGVAATHAKPSTTLRVVTQRTVRLPYGRAIVSLSSDGRYLLALDGLTVSSGSTVPLCLYDIATLTRQHCVAILVRDAPTLVLGIAWSPDAKHVAFTVSRGTSVDQSMVVLDVRMGTLTRLPPLTGATGNDADPTWSADWRSLTFVRYNANDTWADIDRFDMGTGVIRRILTLDRDHAPINNGFSSLRLLHGSRMLLYVASNPFMQGGLMLMDVTTRRTRTLVTESDPLRQGVPEVPVLVDVTPDGATALIYFPYPQAGGPPENKSVFDLIDLPSGRVRPLLSTAGPGLSFSGPIAAAFSPDGTKVVYLYGTATARTSQIVVGARDLRNPVSYALRVAHTRMPLFAGSKMSYALAGPLNWASNNTIYIGYSGTGDNMGLLLTVKSSVG